MTQSHLINRRNELEEELRLMNRGGVPFNPRRKQQLLDMLLIIERDIARLGFSAEEIKQNDFRYAGLANTVSRSRQYLIQPPMWAANEKKAPPPANENVSYREAIAAARREAEARVAPLEAVVRGTKE
jgi:hypothetical protein